MHQFAEAYRDNPEIRQKTDEAVGRLLARSATDMDFRQKLLSDPRAAVGEFTGRTVPDSINFRFVENKADATFVLPDVVEPGAELSEAELETVAGGDTGLTVGLMIAVAFLAFSAGYASD